jgi:hypothetical protein
LKNNGCVAFFVAAVSVRPCCFRFLQGPRRFLVKFCFHFKKNVLARPPAGRFDGCTQPSASGK